MRQPSRVKHSTDDDVAGTRFFGLQSTTNIFSPEAWTNVGVTPASTNEIYFLTVTMGGAQSTFYRLHQP